MHFMQNTKLIPRTLPGWPLIANSYVRRVKFTGRDAWPDFYHTAAIPTYLRLLALHETGRAAS